MSHSHMDMDMPSTSTTSAASSSTTSMTMSMVMTFHTGTGDALWWDSWTPKSAVSYTFTLLFLLCLSASSRLLAAYMASRERSTQLRNIRLAQKLLDERRSAGRNNSVVSSSTGSVLLGQQAQTGSRIGSVGESVEVVDVEKTPGVASEQLLSDESSTVKNGVQSVKTHHPWRLSADLPRGALQFFQSGLHFMLMLAIMSFNAGYFLAVVFGILLGEVAFGRFAFPGVPLASNTRQ